MTREKPVTRQEVATIARRIIRHEIQRAMKEMSKRQDAAIGFMWTPPEDTDDGDR